MAWKIHVVNYFSLSSCHLTVSLLSLVWLSSPWVVVEHCCISCGC